MNVSFPGLVQCKLNNIGRPDCYKTLEQVLMKQFRRYQNHSLPQIPRGRMNEQEHTVDSRYLEVQGTF